MAGPEQSEDKTRQRVLEAAGAIFAEKGFEKATVRDICAQAQVNLGAVNYHFRDKMSLYVETILYAHEVVFEQVPLPEWDAQTPPSRKLRDFITTMLKRMLLVKQLPWQARLMMREFVSPTHACQELAERYIRPHHQLLVAIIRELVSIELPSYQVDQLAFSVVGQCLFYKMHGHVMELLIPASELETRYGVDQLADSIARFTLAGLSHLELSSNISPPTNETN